MKKSAAFLAGVLVLSACDNFLSQPRTVCYDCLTETYNPKTQATLSSSRKTICNEAEKAAYEKENNGVKYPSGPQGTATGYRTSCTIKP